MLCRIWQRLRVQNTKRKVVLLRTFKSNTPCFSTRTFKSLLKKRFGVKYYTCDRLSAELHNKVPTSEASLYRCVYTNETMKISKRVYNAALTTNIAKTYDTRPVGRYSKTVIGFPFCFYKSFFLLQRCLKSDFFSVLPPLSP